MTATTIIIIISIITSIITGYKYSCDRDMETALNSEHFSEADSTWCCHVRRSPNTLHLPQLVLLGSYQPPTAEVSCPLPLAYVASFCLIDSWEWDLSRVLPSCTEKNASRRCKFIGLMNRRNNLDAKWSNANTTANDRQSVMVQIGSLCMEADWSNMMRICKWNRARWWAQDLASELTTRIALLTTIVLDDCLFPEAPELSAEAAAFSSVFFFLCIALEVLVTECVT